MNEYEGAWITTYTGRKFHFLNSQPNEIDIVDIAHHLSLICRFTGACKVFYSVAEHSIRVAELVPPDLRLAALLHDAAEAYIGDISRPVKYTHKLTGMELVIQSIIEEKFGINYLSDGLEIIKEADNVLIATESRDLMDNTEAWAPLPAPLPTKIIPLSSEAAEVMFLLGYKIYGGKE